MEKITYRTKKYLPIKLALAYLNNDLIAISKIQSCYVDYSGWIKSIQGIETNDIRIETFASVKETSLPSIFSNLKNNGDSVDLELIEDDKDNDGLFPEDYRDKYPVPFEFEAKTTIDNIYVKKRDVYQIETRWNLNTLDSVLDTEFPQEYDGEEIEGNPVIEVDDDKKPDGRKTRHEIKREDIFGALFALVIYKYNECKDSNGKVTAIHIANTLNKYAFLFWPERQTTADEDNDLPLKVDTIKGYISHYLKKVPKDELKKIIDLDEK